MISFPGIGTELHASITISQGIQPAVAVLTNLPADLPSLQPGNLRIGPDTSYVTLPDCLPLNPIMRQALARTDRSLNHWRQSLLILDHRWRWMFGSVSGEYNRRLPNGLVDTDTQKTPQELATILLQAMGESGFDVSSLPTSVFPYCNWQSINPALALWQLCEKCACVVTGGEFAQVRIYRRGQGASLPSGGTAPVSRFPLISRPGRIIVRGGPTVFQSKFKLQAIGAETDGEQSAVNNLEYKPGNGWSNEPPLAFPGLMDTELSAALATVWRWYRVQAQADGDLTVPGCNDPVSAIDQCFPLSNAQLSSAADLDGKQLSLPGYVDGVFWPYSDDGENSDDDTLFTGTWKLLEDRGIVEFPYPLFQLDENGNIEAAELFLTASHHVQKTDGSLVAIERIENVGGSGADLVISRPEVFGTVIGRWDGTSRNGTISTVQEAENEADRYASLFAAAFANSEMDDREYPGIVPVRVDGRIVQARYQGGINRPYLTRASTGKEFDIYSVPAAERERRNLAEAVR